MNKKVMWGGIGLLIFSVLTFICWAATTATWTWTGTVGEVGIVHYTDSTCETVVTTHTSTAATGGEIFTSWVENEGTVPVKLEIAVSSEDDWVTATSDYTPETTIPVDSGLSILWTLSITDPEAHAGAPFTLHITITADEAP